PTTPTYTLSLHDALPICRPDLHRRTAAGRLDADRADPLEPPAGGGHHGAARRAGARARHRDAGDRRRPPLPAGARDTVPRTAARDRKSTRLNSSHVSISY